MHPQPKDHLALRLSAELRKALAMTDADRLKSYGTLGPGLLLDRLEQEIKTLAQG